MTVSCSASPPCASTIQIEPNSENASRLPSGDQVGSEAPHGVESVSAAEVVLSRQTTAAPRQARMTIEAVRACAGFMASVYALACTSNCEITIRYRCIQIGLDHAICSLVCITRT